jgi:2-C-methyl-D-erythritol 2,4-cyclodiphosphate synthase
MDAILSGLSLRDIGYHFPPTDPKFKDADSMKLLEHVLTLIYNNGYKVKSVSAVIMAEKPKLLKHIPAITKNLSDAVGIEIDSIGIGATTLEGLGFVGREEGICVHANAILEKI